MAYRFTNTDKWSDAWFSELKPNEKLLFMYLCDNCDIAGFIELTPKKWAFDIGLNNTEILGALEGLSRGLINSKSNDCIYLRNFLKHQKNLPINEKNNAHLGIIKRFDSYKIKFEIENIETFINQEVKPLLRGYGNGNGKGNGSDNGNDLKEFNFKNSLLNLGIEKNIVEDWLKVRKNKKAVNTEIAFNAIKLEIEKCKLTPNECIIKAVESSWSGFKSDWIKEVDSNKQTHVRHDKDANGNVY